MRTKISMTSLATASLLAVFVTSVSAQDDDRRGTPPFIRAQMAFSVFDSDGDNALSQDEVPGPVWERLAIHDLDEDGVVSRQELKSQAADRVFGNFDENEDGLLTEDEVPAMLWNRLSKADADESGSVSVEEFLATQGDRPSRV